ncbi:MAG: hypothetical protein JO331_14225 [Verrucomicrobia bacterium]|nr:hypothetical protein [Verrucomicrobiota bacterium]MBV9299502.1 hypothetical protein [Verrucomicrobiota bacterium]
MQRSLTDPAQQLICNQQVIDSNSIAVLLQYQWYSATTEIQGEIDPRINAVI